MSRKKTYIDSGVLITAFQGIQAASIRANQILNDQELEQQLLSLDLGQRIRILQLLAQSLTVPPASQLFQAPDELDLTCDRSPQHPLRGIPITIPPNFDEPMPELWDAVE